VSSQYATAAELKALPGAGAYCATIADADCNAALQRASGRADDYLREYYALPLTSWGASLKQVVCHIALYWLTAHEGFDAMSAGSTPRQLYEDALATLERMATRGSAGIVDATPEIDEGGAKVYSRPRRGW
jgi:phage gp36-like protein